VVLTFASLLLVSATKSTDCTVSSTPPDQVSPKTILDSTRTASLAQLTAPTYSIESGSIGTNHLGIERLEQPLVPFFSIVQFTLSAKPVFLQPAPTRPSSPPSASSEFNAAHNPTGGRDSSSSALTDLLTTDKHFGQRQKLLIEEVQFNRNFNPHAMFPGEEQGQGGHRAVRQLRKA
jgi:hypothetical protein